jgi:hypothetical protein
MIGPSSKVYNITNGDYFRWEHLWPKYAEYFGINPAPPFADPIGRDDG